MEPDVMPEPDAADAWAAAAAIRDMADMLLSEVPACNHRADALVHLGRAADALERAR